MDSYRQDNMLKMDELRKSHELTREIYKNLLENFEVNVQRFLHSLKIISKNQQNVCAYNKGFISSLYELGNGAQIFKGYEDDIEIGFRRFAEMYNIINEHLFEFANDFMKDTYEPIRRKFADDNKHIQIVYKKYLIGYEYNINKFSSANVIYQKKLRSSVKTSKFEKDFLKAKDLLEEYIFKNLKMALFEAKNRYCYILNRLNKDLENKVNCYNQIIQKIVLFKQNNVLPASLNNGFSTLERNQFNTIEKQSSLFNLNKFEDNVSNKHDDGKEIYYNKTNTNPRFKKSSFSEYDSKVSTVNNIIRLKANNMFIATNDFQLSIYPGDILLAEENSEYMGWIFGTNENKNYGWFPRNYTNFFDDESFETLTRRLNKLEFLFSDCFDKQDQNMHGMDNGENTYDNRIDSGTNTLDRKKFARKNLPNNQPPPCP